MEPVQTLALIESSVKQAEAQTEISKSAPAWSRQDRVAAGNAEIHAKHHQGRHQGGVPKNPAPGKMVGIPALKRCCDVARENNVRGIGRDAKNDQALRERRKNEGHGEGIKSPGRQAGQHLQRQHGPEIS